MSDVAEKLYDRANVLKAMAHPVRLCILRGLLDSRGCNVTKMHSCLNLPQSTISQHLAKLKAAGIVISQRRGVENIYSINQSYSEMLSHLLAGIPAIAETEGMGRE